MWAWVLIYHRTRSLGPTNPFDKTQGEDTQALPSVGEITRTLMPVLTGTLTPVHLQGCPHLRMPHVLRALLLRQGRARGCGWFAVPLMVAICNTFFDSLYTNHVEERVSDQAQAQPPCIPLPPFLGYSHGIPQMCEIGRPAPVVKSLLWGTGLSPSEVSDLDPRFPGTAFGGGA